MKSPLQPDIHALIEATDFTSLKAGLREMDVHDLAELIGGLEEEDLALVFRLLPQGAAADIFGSLEIDQQEKVISVLSSERVAAIVNEMPPDDRTELLEELPGEIAQRLLKSLRGDELRIARSLLAYPEDSIGRLMTPEYVAVKPDWTTEQVLAHLRQVAPTKETLYVVYVVDDSGKLLDEIPLERIILAEPTAEIGQLMDETAASLNASDDQETAIDLFKKYDAVALPVVNNEGILVGIVTFDDVMDVAEEENTEDFQKMAGVIALEGGYFQTSYLQMLRKRLPWLALLLVAETIAVVVLYSYEKFLAVLAMFMPLINATAGNTGNQVAGLMIRGFAVQEMDVIDWWRVMLRELLRGVTMGLVLAVIAGAIVIVFGRGYPTALAAGAAMLVAVTLANMLGAMLPFFFKRIGVDPAVTSGPFIACLMDVSSIVIFFSIATALLAVSS